MSDVVCVCVCVCVCVQEREMEHGQPATYLAVHDRHVVEQVHMRTLPGRSRSRWLARNRLDSLLELGEISCKKCMGMFSIGRMDSL